MTPRIDVVGLGPGDGALTTPATLALIEAAQHRFLRTSRHPSAVLVGGATSFDDEYEHNDTFAEVYEAISDRLLAAAAEHGSVLYAVPGSPLVLERTVEHLRRVDGVEVVVHPAMSFLDVAWARLGIDPVDSAVQLVDGHRFAEQAWGATGPLLVAHCHNQRVLSDVKLAVDEPGDQPVVVLQRLGTDDEAVFEVDWWELDREVEADHLTSIYIATAPRSSPVALGRLADLVATLRRECPWDREQTHGSLRRHLIEETFEVIDAIDDIVEIDGPIGAAADPAHADLLDAADVALSEELGDLLFQALIHATIAEETGRFGVTDVADGIHDKLVARHPHVFGDAEAVDDAAELVVAWEAAKVDEKGRDSVFDGIPAGLPALALVGKVQRKAATLGVETVPDATSLRAHLDVVVAGGAADGRAVGSLIAAIVAAANAAEVDAEDAVRDAAHRLRDRVRAVEVSGGDPGSLSAFDG